MVRSCLFCVFATGPAVEPSCAGSCLRPAGIRFLAWVPSSYSSPSLRSLVCSLCIPLIDPRHEAQMGPSGAKEQRQHPPLLQSVCVCECVGGGHTLLPAKCLLFRCSLLSCWLTPSDARLPSPFRWLTVTSLPLFSLGPGTERERCFCPPRPLRAICHQSPLPSLALLAPGPLCRLSEEFVGSSVCTSGFCKFVSGRHLVELPVHAEQLLTLSCII